MKNSWILILFLIVTSQFVKGEEMSLPIVPTPQIVNNAAGYFNLTSNIKIILKGEKQDVNNFSAVKIRKTLMESAGINAQIEQSRNEEKNIILNQSDFPDQVKNIIPAGKLDESYLLVIDEKGITVQAPTPKGIFYGTMSLIQLLEKAGKNPLSAIQIIDWSDMKVRGISDDISRGQVSTLDNFKKIISFLARYKMNVYMPYIEDMIQFESYPSIGKGRGALTKDEIKELVNFASENFVEIIPIFQTLGHYENILSQKEYLKYAEFPGAACLNVSNDSTYIFLENMLKEVFELFPSEYFNMGADESHDVGLGYSKYLVDQSSLGKVHLEHYKKVYAIVKKYGKKVIMYGDELLNHKDNLKELPKDIIVIDWHYRPDGDYPSTKIFQEAGFEYYVSPSVWNFQTTFPVQANAIPNIKNIIMAGLENSSTGIINSNWGDYGAETFKELNYFGYAWSAQCAWNYKASDEDKFYHDFLYDFFGTDDPRLTSIYKTFTNPASYIVWHEAWRHPLLPLRTQNWWEAKMQPDEKIASIKTILPKCEKELTDLHSVVKNNLDQLIILEFLVQFDYWYKDKLQTQIKLNEFMLNKQKNSEELKEMIDQNVSSLKKLKDEYKFIWLKYYKPENLWMIEDKFNRLISYFEETKNQVTDGELKNPQLASKWIYVKTGDTTFSRSARFKKNFTISEIPQTAHLQLLGDTYAKLYINGNFVDEVYARRSLSLWSEYKRIKFLDIAKYLKKGENEIVVEVKNYNRTGSAGFNLISQIETGNSTLEILSDESWQGQDLSDNTDSWNSTVIKDYPFIITAPNFKTGRSSWIER
ncbi:MAG: family 20 glycosylhydrolase [Ignavibacteriales bacterium]|nr:family 20 glycosylhydrolase [Ignavibacteriales bacterium]